MKREAVFEGELEKASVEERLAALKQMYASSTAITPDDVVVKPAKESKSSKARIPQSKPLSKFRMMVCNWPGKVIRTGEASGVRYVFEDGKEVPVDTRDVGQLLRVVRTTGGCCGHTKRKVQVFAYA